MRVCDLGSMKAKVNWVRSGCWCSKRHSKASSKGRHCHDVRRNANRKYSMNSQLRILMSASCRNIKLFTVVICEIPPFTRARLPLRLFQGRRFTQLQVSAHYDQSDHQKRIVPPTSVRRARKQQRVPTEPRKTS
jgi:hypothetical protein